MSAISKIASRVLGGGSRPGTGVGGKRRTAPGGTPTGGSSTDAAIGRKVRGLLGKGRR